MGRPRRAPLPRGIYARRRADGSIAYSISFQDGTGRQRQERVGGSLEDAVRVRRDRLAEVAAGTYVPPAERVDGRDVEPQNAPAPITVRTYSSHFLEVLRGEKRRTVADTDQRLRDHVFPTFGDVAIVDLRPKAIAAWVMKLRAAGELAPKTIVNVHGVLSSLLSLAVFEELIPSNPAKGLRAGTLPKVEKRKVPPWSRDEIVTWISDPRVPWDRRIAYAVASFTGTRCGEVAGMRVRDLDRRAKPLWMWRLETQYDGQPLKGKDAGNPRSIPIHAELAALLDVWLRDGWPQLVGRHPGPDDFVVPREDGTVHSKQSLGAKAVTRNAKLVGIEKGDRDFHSFRRSMITLARTDGADRDVLERVTHNSAGEMIDGYTLYGWETLCAAVSCLRIAPVRMASLSTIPRAVGDPEHDRDHDRTTTTSGKAEIQDGGAGSRTRVRK